MVRAVRRVVGGAPLDRRGAAEEAGAGDGEAQVLALVRRGVGDGVARGTLRDGAGGEGVRERRAGRAREVHAEGLVAIDKRVGAARDDERGGGGAGGEGHRPWRGHGGVVGVGGGRARALGGVVAGGPEHRRGAREVAGAGEVEGQILAFPRRRVGDRDERRRVAGDRAGRRAVGEGRVDRVRQRHREGLVDLGFGVGRGGDAEGRGRGAGGDGQLLRLAGVVPGRGGGAVRGSGGHRHLPVAGGGQLHGERGVRALGGAGVVDAERRIVVVRDRAGGVDGGGVAGEARVDRRGQAQLHRLVGLVERVAVHGHVDGLADIARREGEGSRGDRRVVGGGGRAARRGVGVGHGHRLAARRRQCDREGQRRRAAVALVHARRVHGQRRLAVVVGDGDRHGRCRHPVVVGVRGADRVRNGGRAGVARVVLGVGAGGDRDGLRGPVGRGELEAGAARRRDAGVAARDAHRHRAGGLARQRHRVGALVFLVVRVGIVRLREGQRRRRDRHAARVVVRDGQGHVVRVGDAVAAVGRAFDGDGGVGGVDVVVSGRDGHRAGARGVARGNGEHSVLAQGGGGIVRQADGDGSVGAGGVVEGGRDGGGVVVAALVNGVWRQCQGHDGRVLVVRDGQGHVVRVGDAVAVVGRAFDGDGGVGGVDVVVSGGDGDRAGARGVARGDGQHGVLAQGGGGIIRQADGDGSVGTGGVVECGGHGAGVVVAALVNGVWRQCQGHGGRVLVVRDGQGHGVGVGDAVSAGGGGGDGDGDVGGIDVVVGGGDGDRAGARGGPSGDGEHGVLAEGGGSAGRQADGEGDRGAGGAVEAGGDGTGVGRAALVDGGGCEPERRYREGFVISERDRGRLHRKAFQCAEDADGLVDLGDGVVRGRKGEGAAAAGAIALNRDGDHVPGGVVNTLPGGV